MYSKKYLSKTGKVITKGLPSLQNFYQRRPQGLAGALKDLGIAFEGREHSGICDTRNTAALVSRMVQDGCILTITKTLGPKTKVRY